MMMKFRSIHVGVNNQNDETISATKEGKEVSMYIDNV